MLFSLTNKKKDWFLPAQWKNNKFHSDYAPDTHTHSGGAVASKGRLSSLPAMVGISHFFLGFRVLRILQRFSAELTIFILEQGREDPACQR